MVALNEPKSAGGVWLIVPAWAFEGDPPKWKPVALWCDEVTATVRAMACGETVVVGDDHAYISAEWLARRYP